jgi:hypothetical protein
MDAIAVDRVRACPACEAGERRPITSMKHCKVVRCAGCGLVFCDPLPRIASKSSGESSILTEEAFTAHMIRDSPGRFDRYRALANTRYDHYSKVLARANFSLLEVGCGDAGMAAEMGAHGVDYQGIDIDPRRSRRHGPEGSSPAASATSSRATRT